MTCRTTPNFFIVGAPKCGTTALAAYLSEHENLFVSWPKEPHFFATDFPHHRYVTELDAYLGLFASAEQKHVAIGEASVWYLYSEEACINIRQFRSDAKIIVMLRNPVDLVYSLHSQSLYTIDEDEPDFERAWRLQEARRDGKQLPPKCRTPATLQYREIGKLGKQLQRLLQIFSREQVQVIVFDDFVRNTAGVYKETLAFLGVPDDGRQGFPVINESKYNKSLSLGRFLHYPPQTLQRAWLITKGWLGLSFAPGDRLRGLNTKEARRAPLNQEFRRELLNEFDKDIRLVESLLGRELPWG